MIPQTLSSPTPFSKERAGLSTPVQYLKGVGPFKAQILEKVGIRTVEDLLFYFPRAHQDRKITPIKKAIPGSKFAFRVDVLSADFKRVGPKLGQYIANLKDISGQIQALWFKRLSFKYDVFSAVRRDVQPGKKIIAYGSLEWNQGFLQFHVEDFEPDEETGGSHYHVDRIVPTYPLTEGLQDRWLRPIIYHALKEYGGLLTETLPESLVKAHQLLPFAESVRQYHYPQSWTDRDKARHRLAFEEFFHLELALAMNRKRRLQDHRAFPCEIKKTLLTPFKELWGLTFTKGQTRAINEIFQDMQKSAPMNRLLQGDVGSGKTIVGLSAALLTIENEHQVVFLAPTEILAQQHSISIGKIFDPLKLSWAVLTGSTAPSERKKIIDGLRSGRIKLVVGTHALLNEEIIFKSLGLAIIDEQHRFGVRQRANLVTKSTQEKGEEALLEKTHPHVLIMTATPIPRTLALTLYGDLDVSIIEDLPKGRPAITTSIRREKETFRRIGDELAQGRQGYVVIPLVEESERLSKRANKNVRAALTEYDRMKTVFPAFKVGLLHGQMGADEKTKIMDQFRQKKLDLLVATPVIEVGIDVPNATVIAIQNPERFGLAQLHQLRGRVGRGTEPSQCLLIVDEMEGEAPERLTVFCSLYNGFALAEEDLRRRGPGEFIGESQHGIPFFRVGDLLKDDLLIAQARQGAHSLVEGELHLTMREYDILNRQLNRKFGKKVTLSQIG